MSAGVTFYCTAVRESKLPCLRKTNLPMLNQHHNHQHATRLFAHRPHIPLSNVPTVGDRQMEAPSQI